MRALLIAVTLLGASVTRAETPSSPYQLHWSFRDDDLSAIDVDRGDLSASRFQTDYELVKYLEGLKPEKPKRSKPGEAAAPARDLRVDRLGSDGVVRTTARYSAPLAVWRKRLGEAMVERLEDEFDAHLRMILPRKVPPAHVPTDGDREKPKGESAERRTTGNREQEAGNRQPTMSDLHDAVVRGFVRTRAVLGRWGEARSALPSEGGRGGPPL